MISSDIGDLIWTPSLNIPISLIGVSFFEDDDKFCDRGILLKILSDCNFLSACGCKIKVWSSVACLIVICDPIEMTDVVEPVNVTNPVLVSKSVIVALVGIPVPNIKSFTTTLSRLFKITVDIPTTVDAPVTTLVLFVSPSCTVLAVPIWLSDWYNAIFDMLAPAGGIIGST